MANSGAGGRSANVTVTPPRWFDRGMVSAVASLLTSPVPKIETSPPGATGCPFAKLAPLSTPPSATLGVCAEQTPTPISTVSKQDKCFISKLVSILPQVKLRGGEGFVKT